MTSPVFRLSDWQENLLGTDEAGRYLQEKIDAAPDADSALCVLKAFMLVSFAQLDEIPRIMGEGPSGEQEAVSSICRLLRDDQGQGAAPLLTDDDVSLAAKVMPAHFMAVYEKNPLLAGHDFVIFNILGTLAEVHGRVVAQMSSGLSNQAMSKANACVSACQCGTAESAAAKRLGSLYHWILRKDPDLDDAGRCMKSCRKLAGADDPQCAHADLVGRVIDEAFASYEKDCAKGLKPGYPNPFGLKLTPELKVQDRGVMASLCDAFSSARLGAERRERMKSAVLQIPGLAELVDFFRTAASRHVKLDFDGFERICAMDEASRRFARVAEEDAGVARFIETRREKPPARPCKRRSCPDGQIDQPPLNYPFD